MSMPIILPALPIAERIAAEGVRVISEADHLNADGISVIPEEQAIHQDIRPLEIAVLNLMPHKQRTEKHLARLLGHTALQVRLTLLRTATYQSKNESEDHLKQFYKKWEDIANRQFDGLIVTGAPVEEMDWKDVHFWKELESIFTWARTNVCSRLSICWGAQAALKHAYGIEKQPLESKAFGIFPHHVTDWKYPLVEGFDDEFLVPVSRHTEIKRADIEQIPDLHILAESHQTGLYLLQHANKRDTYMFNHPEYGAKTLKKEYERDCEAGRRRRDEVPVHYFPDNDPRKCPINKWRAHARLFYANWLKQMYELTAYDLKNIPSIPA